MRAGCAVGAGVEGCGVLVGGVLSWLGSLKPSKSVLVGRRLVRSRGAGGRGLMTVWEHEGFFEECGNPVAEGSHKKDCTCLVGW